RARVSVRVRVAAVTRVRDVPARGARTADLRGGAGAVAVTVAVDVIRDRTPGLAVARRAPLAVDARLRALTAIAAGPRVAVVARARIVRFAVAVLVDAVGVAELRARTDRARASAPRGSRVVIPGHAGLTARLANADAVFAGMRAARLFRGDGTLTHRI